MPRKRLDQVDSMRPLKQAGVVSTHVLLFFGPAASVSAGAGALLTLLHVSREGFFFISACMLTYAYCDVQRGAWGRFYRRRLVAVLIPYLCWTVIYYLYNLRGAHFASAGAALDRLLHTLVTGYYQLYFLVVIMQFYLVFPLVLALLRRTRGHHGLVVAAAAAAQVALTICVHWRIVTQPWVQSEASSYVLYLIGGAVVAFHLDEVHAWLGRHARLVIALTALAAAAAEGVYYLAETGVTTALGAGDDAFQPSVIAWNVGAIACMYLAGVALVKPGRSRRFRAVVRSGSDNSYGIYLSQLLIIDLLIYVGYQRLLAPLPWPVTCAITVAVVYLSCVALTSVLARTPLAVPLTGRPRQTWRSLRPGHAATPGQLTETEHHDDKRLDPVG
jgi:peptidoglycan/LPS O-acetylase OafA/YrhL